jgi:hypothetical protein
MKTKGINNNLESTGGTAVLTPLNKELPNIQTRPLVTGINGGSSVYRDKSANGGTGS